MAESSFVKTAKNKHRLQIDRQTTAPHETKDVNGVVSVHHFPVLAGPGGRNPDPKTVRQNMLAACVDMCIVAMPTANSIHKQLMILSVLHRFYLLGKVSFVESTVDCFANWMALTVSSNIAAEYVYMSAEVFDAMGDMFAELSYGPNVDLTKKNVFKRFIQHLNKWGINVAGDPEDFGNPAKIVFRAVTWNKNIPMKIPGITTRRANMFLLPIDGMLISDLYLHKNDKIISNEDTRTATMKVACAFDNSLHGFELAKWLMGRKTDKYLEWSHSDRIGIKNALLYGQVTAIDFLAQSMKGPVDNFKKTQDTGGMHLCLQKPGESAEVGVKRKAEKQGSSGKKTKKSRFTKKKKQASKKAVALLMGLAHNKI